VVVTVVLVVVLVSVKAPVVRVTAEGKTTVRLSIIERWAEPLLIASTGPSSARAVSCWLTLRPRASTA
jgi:hypothetical protein